MRFDRTDRANAEVLAKQDLYFTQTKEGMEIHHKMIKGTQSMISQLATKIDLFVVSSRLAISS